MKLNNGIKLTWLGHGTFTTEFEGQICLIDPWVASNPACPDALKTFDKLDVILITHTGTPITPADAVDLAKQHSPTVVAMVEVSTWLSGKGVENTIGMKQRVAPFLSMD